MGTSGAWRAVHSRESLFSVRARELERLPEAPRAMAGVRTQRAGADGAGPVRWATARTVHGMRLPAARPEGVPGRPADAGGHDTRAERWRRDATAIQETSRCIR